MARQEAPEVTRATVAVEDIIILGPRRALNIEAVEKLTASIAEMGLRHPITVRWVDKFENPEEVDGWVDGYVLVAGAHRIEALRRLGVEYTEVDVVYWDEDRARMWEIAENLHRAELTTLQRSEQIAEWVRLSGRVSSQVAKKPLGGRPESGINKAARELSIDKDEAYRAVRVASLTDEAKEAARDTGLDDNRSALLRVAMQAPERQAQAVREIAERKASKIDSDVKDRAANEVAQIIAEYVPADAWDALKANLYAAGANNIANALTNITGQSIMDRRFA